MKHPSRHIYDPEFVYVSSRDTNLTETFRRIVGAQQVKAAENVTQINAEKGARAKLARSTAR